MAILALDQGTTSSRAIIFDADGAIRAQQNRAFTQFYPQPGWVEHDPEEILFTQLAALREAVAQSGLPLSAMQALGITNQRETIVVWDRITGRPIHKAIVWQCRRTADVCIDLQKQGLEAMIRAKTGLPIDAYFSATKLQWILNHVPDAKLKAQNGQLLCGTVDTYLLWHLTGRTVHATDYTNASRTMLFNIHEKQWDAELLDLFGIPRCMLPEVKPSGSLFGMTDGGLIGAEIPIGGVAGDQQAALFGQCCFAPGEAKNTYGTGCFLLMNTGQTPVASENGLLTTMAATCANEPCEYVLEGSVFIAGAAIQWLRDELKLIDTAAETEALAQSVPDTDGVVLVPAFTGLGAPYWDMYARGTLFGLTRGTNRAHVARAALESIAWQTYDVLRVMEHETGIDLAALKVDGGACANNFLMQFQADVLNTHVHRPKVRETTALGAAYLAGLTTGVYHSREDLRRQWALDRVFASQKGDDWRSAQSALWHKAVSRTQHWLAAE